MQCRLMLAYQIIHYSNNHCVFSYAVYYCAIIPKNKSQGSSLHHVVLSTQFNHTIYPWYYSNAKCAPMLLTLSLTHPMTCTYQPHSLTHTD